MAKADPDSVTQFTAPSPDSDGFPAEVFERLIDDDVQALAQLQALIDLPPGKDALHETVTELAAASRRAAEGCTRLSP